MITYYDTERCAECGTVNPIRRILSSSMYEIYLDDRLLCMGLSLLGFEVSRSEHADIVRNI